MTLSSLLLPLGGGILIGLSAGALWLLNGKVAGISGIVDGVVTLRRGHWPWRVAFLLGLLAGGEAIALAAPASMPFDLRQPIPYMIAAGLLVGFGSRLGNGCTSGHGVCGMGRLSPRSLVNVAVFTAVAGMTVYVVLHGIGGTP